MIAPSPINTAARPANGLHVVFGAGPVGRAIAAQLATLGYKVRIVNRSGKVDALPPGVEIVCADASTPREAESASRDADVVYHCAAPPYHRWPQEFPALQNGILHGASRAGAVLVVVENLYAYGVGGELTEDLPFAAETRKGTVRAKMSEQLRAVHEKGDARIVIGRASDFFGPETRVTSLGERVWPNLLKGKTISWIGDPDVPHTFTYVPDFARALIRLGSEESAWGQAWHVPSPTTLSFREIMNEAAKILGQPPTVIRKTPKLALRLIGMFDPAAGELVEILYAYERAFSVSHRRYAKAFGDEATPWDTSLKATLEWWRAEVS